MDRGMELLTRVRHGVQRWKSAKTSLDEFRKKYVLKWKRRVYEAGDLGEVDLRSIRKSRIDEILPIARKFITWGYFLGFHPFKWDTEASGIILLTKRWEIYRWILMRTFTICCVSAIGFQTILSLMLEGSHLYRWEDMFGTIFFMLLLLGECLHFNTMRRKEAAAAFVNGVLLYFRQIESRLNRHRFTIRNRSVIGSSTLLFLKVTFCTMFLMSGIHAVFYTLYCKYHILYLIYPGICASATESPLNHRWNVLVLPLTIIQFILAAQICGSLVIYALGSVYIFMGSELLIGIREAEGINVLTGVIPQNIAILTGTWSLGFRSWQIMHNLLHDLIGEFAIPSFVAILVVQAVLTLFSLLSFTVHHRQFSVPFILFLVFICLFDLLILAIVNSKVMAYTDNSWKWLESRRRFVIKRNKMNDAFLRSSPKLSIRIASFGIVQRSTILTIIYIVADRSITLLIWNA